MRPGQDIRQNGSTEPYSSVAPYFCAPPARLGCCAILLRYMTKLQEAIAKISTLPEATRENIVEELLLHVKKIEHLRAQTQKGINLLDRGDYAELDIQE